MKAHAVYLLMLTMAIKAHADDSCLGLPDCFCSKDKTSVNCEGRQLIEIPNNIPATAKKLYLSYNHITVVKPYQLAYLPHLTLIKLDHNSIAAVDAFAFGN